MINFANNFRLLREHSGLNQEDAAKLFGVGRSTISSWECGTRSPKTKDALRIAEYFNVDIDKLITGHVFEDSNSITLADDELELVKAYRSLSAEQQSAALGVLKAMVK